MIDLFSEYFSKLEENKRTLQKTLEEIPDLYEPKICFNGFECIPYLEVDSYGNIYFTLSNFDNVFISDREYKDITIGSIGNKIHVFGKLRENMVSREKDGKYSYDFTLNIWNQYTSWLLSDNYEYPEIK